MSALEKNLGNFFKSEIKASGRKLVAEDKVSITGGNDTTIKVYVRASPPIVVHLMSDGIGSPALTADCSCPAGKKSQFCKHVWGALLAADGKFPDFLSEKIAIEKSEAPIGLPEGEEESYTEAAKRRASEYRKEQYQKQKTRLKDAKRERQARETAPVRAFPDEVAASLEYFDRNGFPMPGGPDPSVISDAKRTLSRVFHPDRGGSHDETVELNRNCEVLLGFLRG